MIWLLCFVFLTKLPQAPSPEDETAHQLAKVRRIYVDILTGGDSALKLRELLMASLQNSKLFIVTENQDKADAILKGAGDDKAFTDTFSSSEGINAHTQLGGSSDVSNSSYDAGVGGGSKTGSSHSMGLSVGENESRKSEERKHEAMATVRLVTKEGDVIWSATAESLGGKFLGASADVADKIAKRLAADYRLAKGR